MLVKTLLDRDGTASWSSASENSVRIDRDQLLKEINCYKLENEQFRTLIVEMDAATKARSTCLVNMEENVATIETEKELQAKSNTELLSPAIREYC